jgi:hypothetical protein
MSTKKLKRKKKKRKKAIMEREPRLLKQVKKRKGTRYLK